MNGNVLFLRFLFLYESEYVYVCISSITGNFGFQPCSHGDFLGAILGTGISREKLGDILIQVSSDVSCLTKICQLHLQNISFNIVSLAV